MSKISLDVQLSEGTTACSVSMRLTFELTDGSVVDTLGTNSRSENCATQRATGRTGDRNF